MTLSIIIGRKRKSAPNKFCIVEGPGEPTELNRKFNAMSEGDGKGYAEIYLHELMLTGGRKSKVFPEPR